MPKAPTKKLFKLIKSLSRNEKGNFKKFVERQSGQSDSIYLRVFDSIEGQDEFNEDLALSELKRSGSKGGVSRTKVYLYQQILKSLNSSAVYDSVDNQIMDHFRNVEILFEKKLLDECYKEILKAKKKAFKFDRFEFVMQSIMWERRILQSSMDFDSLEKDMNRLAKEEQMALANLSNLVEYRNLFSQVFINVRKTDLDLIEDHQQPSENILDNPLLLDISQAKTVAAKILFYNTISSYCFSIGEIEKAKNNVFAVVKLLEENPERIEEKIMIYFTTLNNLIAVCDQLNLGQEMTLAMDKLRTIPDRFDLRGHKDLEVRIFERSYLFELSRFNREGRFGKGKWLSRQIEQKFEYWEDKIDDQKRIILYFAMATVNFGSGNYSDCLKWVNKLINLDDLDARHKVYLNAYLIQVLAHYEMGNFDFLPYLLNSSKSLFNSEGEQASQERALFNFLDINAKRMDAIDQDSFNSLKTELEQIHVDQKESMGYYHFDFKTWVDSKVAGREFGDSLRDKHLRNSD